MAETYYISVTGNDQNIGAIQTPWRSVEHAWKNSGGGDTVFVRGGNYPDNQIWLANGRRNTTVENPFWTLINYPGERCVFTDTRFIIDDDYIRIEGLQLTGSSFIQAVSWGGLHEHIELIGNDISGSTNVPIYFICNNGLVEGNTIHPVSSTHGIYVMHGDHNVIRNNKISGVNKYPIHIYDEKKYNHPSNITNLLVESNTVIGSQSRSGIIISAGESIDYSIEIINVVLRKNVITHNAEDGITIRYYGRVRDVQIINNSLYGNKAAGLRIAAKDVDQIVVKNNIFSSNRIQIDVSSNLNSFLVSHNLFWQPASIGSDLAGDYSIKENPLFLNPQTGDFHLRKGSPAIDAGTVMDIPFLGDGPDIGACEFNPASDSISGGTP